VNETPPSNESQKGLASAIAAFTIWGLFPVYFVWTQAVPAVEMVAHRVVWSLPFGLAVLFVLKQWRALVTAMRSPKTLGFLFLAAVFLAVNWGVYIYAIQIGEIFQGSLGYYINPLFNVLVGFLVFKERLSRWQTFAIALAATGVAILTIYGGVFPWISLILASTFCVYGALRKFVEVPAMAGLMVEVLVLILPALGYLLWVGHQGASLFGQDIGLTLLLLAAGPITLIPLLCFTFAARRIRLSTLGVLQFIGPTLQFACGLYYGEQFTTAHAWCFGFIWAGVALFALDAAAQTRRPISTPSA
jgi:chloramphenicol-sensitive protein RarD